MNKFKTSFDSLSIPAQAEMIRVAVRNGITNLADIKQKYNEFAEGGDKENQYSSGNLVNAIYETNPREEFLGEPRHHYDFTQSKAWTDAHGFYPDSRGHRDDRVKKPSHPTHPSRGIFDGLFRFNLTDRGMEAPNYTLFGMVDGGQDPQATLYYDNGIVLPEFTVTPKGNYIFNPYDNIKLKFAEGGNLFLTGGPKKPLPQRPRPKPHRAGEQPQYTPEEQAQWDAYNKALAEQKRQLEQQAEEKARKREEAAERFNRSAGVVMGALEQASDIPFTGQEYQQAAEGQRQEKLDKAHDLKLGLDATMEAGELMSAGYGVFRGLTHLNRWLAKRGVRKAIADTYSRNAARLRGRVAPTGGDELQQAQTRLAKWDKRVDMVDKPQVPMNFIGGTADGYQWLTADNSFDAWENGLETGANAAGVVGGMDWFRNIPALQRIGGNKIDNVLDGLGYGAAFWDIGKRLPPLSEYLEGLREKSREQSAKQKSYGGPLEEAVNRFDDGGSTVSNDFDNTLFWHPDKEYYSGKATILPNVTVTPQPKPRKKSSDSSWKWVSPKRTRQATFSDVVEMTDIASGPLLHWTMPSQYIGATRNALESGTVSNASKNFLVSMLAGNTGLFTEEYAAEHPVVATVGNIAFDSAVPIGFKVRNYAQSRSFGKPVVPEGFNDFKPQVRSVSDYTPFAENTPAAQWAGTVNPTRSAAERGRDIMLDWIGSPFYKQRWQSAAPYEDVNPMIKDMAENTRLQQFNYRDRSALSNDGLTNGSTYSTSIKPDITITGDKTIRDYNTGFSVDLASDLGDKATSTSIHELSHLTSGMSGGLEPVIRYGKPIYGSMTEPVKSDYPLINETLIPRGKRYQHFMVDYNDGLLPQESTLLRDVFNNPQQAKESLMGIGHTSEEADQLISALKNSYSYLWNKQEQQAFLKQMFLDDVRPHLNNPNDAREIERFLIMNPDVLDNNPQVKTIMEVIRPGDIKRYAKYLAESLSVLPFINNSNKHQQ